MFEDVGAALGDVALDAAGIHTVKVGPSFGDRRTLVRTVAVAATHLASHYRVAEGQVEFALLVEVALEAGFRRCAWIDDRACTPAGFHVDRGRTVAGLATNLAFDARSAELGMRGVMKLGGHFIVTLRALL